MEVNIKQIKDKVRGAITECKHKLRGLSEFDHDRMDLEGKLYAYEYVLNCILNPRNNPEGYIIKKVEKCQRK